MSVRDEHRTALRALDDDPAAVRAYLTAGSGLPGPRANLELVGAFADAAPDDLVRALADDPDEYLRCCGTCGLGRLVVQAPADARAAPTDLLRARASDGSWRVREAVAMALQRIGDAEPAALRALVSSWVTDPDPLVRRAAVAGICEPRLLRNPATATAALDACAAATATIGALPSDARRDGDVRTLRQALGYCWSVAVAGDPAAGVLRFAALRESSDPDVAWVVHENEKKARLRRVLDRPA
ncbi:HEAT repeat domain-containing protein [Cellulosimicrobium cellulans]|uniref:HEAT repeat domain-containing protein n=1 Tax=Cellulosimicrobium cellulans TaxID=1710 RepID=UPI0020973983|nr:HEAT repeat domain-containing protein [Cellulosimicrobium cellulans]MCO7273550.1 HEAT repeat domain-containing protein [Cellulosimicrobium cellulans]